MKLCQCLGENFPSEGTGNVKTFSLEVLGVFKEECKSCLVRVVDKGREVRPFRLWSKVRFLFEYMYMF